MCSRPTQRAIRWRRLTSQLFCHCNDGLRIPDCIDRRGLLVCASLRLITCNGTEVDVPLSTYGLCNLMVENDGKSTRYNAWRSDPFDENGSRPRISSSPCIAKAVVVMFQSSLEGSLRRFSFDPGRRCNLPSGVLMQTARLFWKIGFAAIHAAPITQETDDRL